VIAITSPFLFSGADPSLATPPAGTATQTLTYDPLDRVTDSLLATGDHKRVAYHPLGVTVTVDGLAPVQTTLDGQDRPVHTERTVNGVVESVHATYDAVGRILEFSLQGGQVKHEFTYDSLGRMTSATDPDVGPRAFHYDDGGRIVSTQNGAGEVVNYGYDGAGRLLTVDGTGVTTRFHYDVARSGAFDHTAGALAWVEEPTGSVDLGYDALGRQTIVQRTLDDGSATITGRETTRFSLSGLARSIDLGDGVVLPIDYDAAGRVAQIEGVWSVGSYNAASQPVSETFHNGATQTYERDILNRPTRITIGSGSGTLYDVSASYNAFNAITTLTDNDGVGLDHSAGFGFDGGGRLTTATIGRGAGAYQFSYAYDGLQNMVQRTASGPTDLGILAGTYQYSVGAPRRLAQIVAAGGNPLASFGYDAAGRQTQHAGKTLSYDALSHLIRVDGVNGGSVQHQYGFDGNRVSTRSAAGDMTYFITPNVIVHNGQRDHYVRVKERLIARITTSDGQPAAVAAIVRGRVALAGLSLAWLVGLVLVAWRLRGARRWRAAVAASLAFVTLATSCMPHTARDRSSALSVSGPVYYHPTYAAGPDLTTDATGHLLEERRTEPFGAAIDAYRNGAVQTVDYRRDAVNALNKLTDPDTGWSDHGARWLAPDTAQWNTPDPPATGPDRQYMAQPWGLNPYQYVSQNPVLFWDPDGRSGAAIGGVVPELWKVTFELAGELEGAGPVGYIAAALVVANAASLASSLQLASRGQSMLCDEYGCTVVDVSGALDEQKRVSAQIQAAIQDERAQLEHIRALDRIAADAKAAENTLPDGTKRNRYALGIKTYLLPFAVAHNARTLLFDPPGAWKATFLKLLRDNSIEFHFNLRGLDERGGPEAGIQRAAANSPDATATDWELKEIVDYAGSLPEGKQEAFWARFSFYDFDARSPIYGKPVENPIR
jgi:RHS repeat-associated protein